MSLQHAKKDYEVSLCVIITLRLDYDLLVVS